jgi:DNA-binding PadR family transcriptional regulator
MMPPEKEKTLDVRKRVLKNFLDVIILRELENNDSLSGYNLIAIIHKKFDLLMSPGTTYALLYSLERKGLIEASIKNGRRVYRLSQRGQKALLDISKHEKEIEWIIKSIFSK